jgi:tRNA threonylcarbamoyl adenosine modification protein YeaZ/ribosomal-protein-alanine acetyltransferase
MKLLCIDTALASCSVCVYDASSKTMLASEQQLMARGHAEALPPMVARIMAQVGIGYADLSRIAVTTGPGTFTGIRVGLSFARALGLARGIKVLGLNTMIATQVAVPDKNCIVVHQAGMSGLFYFYNGEEIELLAPQEIVLRLRGDQLVLGTGAEIIVALSGRSDFKRSPKHDLPSASGFAAYAAIQPEPLNMPDPVYLREADAKPQKDPLRGLGGLEILASQDIELLAKLHAASFETAWTEKDLDEVLAGFGCAALLATSDDGPVGFLIYRAVADEAEIITICVDPSYQRRGAGLKIVSTTKQLLKALKISTLFLEVAADNKEAISLYARAGFVEAGKRKAYYTRKKGETEDAIIMRAQLN